MADEPGPVYRASKVSRGAAWLVLACAAGVSVSALTTAGSASTKAVAVSGLFGLMAWAGLRLEVRATPDALVVCGGRTTRRFPWADIRGFEIDRRTGRDIAVLLKGNARQRLPIVEVATRRVPAETVRDELGRYWKAHRH
ncbi:MAG TPA: PH domain-containing protein [Acidimicrobiia bacterium]|nr:PH domain-containing protein [Acidimicrobiia bacterium]